MAGIIDMQTMRYINLFSRISHVSTTHCFVYNGTIYFAVPSFKVSMAIGKDAAHVRKLREILGKKVKIVAMPEEVTSETLGKFIAEVVEPVDFSRVELNGEGLILHAGRQSKAALIGRNRMREKEMSELLKNYFHIMEFKIV